MCVRCLRWTGGSAAAGVALYYLGADHVGPVLFLLVAVLVLLECLALDLPVSEGSSVRCSASEGTGAMQLVPTLPTRRPLPVTLLQVLVALVLSVGLIGLHRSAAFVAGNLAALLALPPVTLTQFIQWGTAVVVLGGAAGVVSKFLVWVYKSGATALAEHRQTIVDRRAAQDQRIRDVARAEYVALQETAITQVREEQRLAQESLVQTVTLLRSEVDSSGAVVMAALETHSRDDAHRFDTIEARQDGTDEKLDRMDEKLDRVLLGQSGGHD